MDCGDVALAVRFPVWPLFIMFLSHTTKQLCHWIDLATCNDDCDDKCSTLLRECVCKIRYGDGDWGSGFHYGGTAIVSV